MQVKTGTGWKAGCNEEKGLYGAEVVFRGDLTLYEISADMFEKLDGNMRPGEAEELINKGRKLYMRENNPSLPPSTIIIDDDYMDYCPWLEEPPELVGRLMSEAETDFFVKMFGSESEREMRKRKQKEQKNRNPEIESQKEFNGKRCT